MWDKDRRIELAALGKLLIDARRIDDSTGIITRLREIQEIAEKLSESDHVTPRASFWEFLIQEATK